ncbi:MAG: ABC transporter substrate-binding protein [Rhodobacterales bacterium]|jgi:multiple sugar transport system substrate-binding protein
MTKSPQSTWLRRVFSLAGLSMLITIPFAHAASALELEKHEPISMIINQSPWYAGFARTVQDYEDETGNKINLDVTPFVGVLEKIRNSIRAPKGIYDIVPEWTSVMSSIMATGLIEPLTNIDPDFKLDEGLCKYQDTAYWDFEKRSFSNTGELLGVPINGNVQVLYYREDLYKEKGLEVPKTWDDLIENAKILNDPPNIYGMVQRADRTAIEYNFISYLYSQGGSYLKDAKNGDMTVTINSPEAVKAMEIYLRLNREGGYPNPGSVTQGTMIQLLATGKAAQGIGVIAAWAAMDDPDKSAVVGKMNAALIPAGDAGHASGLGHWNAMIPKNVPMEKKKAALYFLKWLSQFDVQVQYTKNGAVPTRCDLITSDIASDPQFRFIKALAQNSEVARTFHPIAEAAEMESILNLRLNQIVTGELSISEGLNTAAQEMYDVLDKANYKTGMLPPL